MSFYWWCQRWQIWLGWALCLCYSKKEGDSCICSWRSMEICLLRILSLIIINYLYFFKSDWAGESTYKSYIVFVESLTIGLRYTITNSPICLMILELDFWLMAFMTVQDTTLTNPFYVAFQTNVEIWYFSCIPIMCIAEYLHLEG